METGLKGKVAVITGGTSGIGKATAYALAAEGCHVLVCGRNAQRNMECQEEFRAENVDIHVAQADVTSKTDLQKLAGRALEKWGRLDIWINNAGAARAKLLLEMQEEEWDQLQTVNLKSCFMGGQVAAGAMKQSGGVIVNVAAFNSIIPMGRRAPYGAAKAGVVNLTRTMSAEWAPYGIRVVAVNPGVVETPMVMTWPEEELNALLRPIALRRFAKPEEIAKPIVFLCSDAASYISGIALEISGGKYTVQNMDECWDMA